MFTPEPVPDSMILAPHHFYVGIIISTFGFFFVWKLYPRTGSLLALLGLCIALDDVIQHMFRVNTPLHYLWWYILYPIVKIIESL